MSGHSKFANIKHKKEKNDAAKGKIFTKIGRELAIAVKEGGSADPVNNSRLRDVTGNSSVFHADTASMHHRKQHKPGCPLTRVPRYC